jgi:hypothetical protein
MKDSNTVMMGTTRRIPFFAGAVAPAGSAARSAVPASIGVSSALSSDSERYPWESQKRDAVSGVTFCHTRAPIDQTPKGVFQCLLPR